MDSSFQVISSKVLRYDVTQLLMFSQTDVFSYVTDQDSVVVKRVTDKPQKIGTVDEEEKPKCLGDGEKGRVLVVGMESGGVKIYTINSSSLSEICFLKLGLGSINTAIWTTHHKSVKPVHLREDQLLIKSYNSPVIDVLTEMQERFSLLAVVLDKKEIVLLAQGFLSIVNIPPERLKREANFRSEFEVSKLRFSPDFRNMYVLCAEPDSIYVLDFDTRVISTHINELNSLTFLMVNSSEMFRILISNVKQLTTDWGVISQTFNLKFKSGIESALSTAEIQLSVQETLLQTIATGVANAGLSQFLKNDIHSFKALVQFDERVNLLVRNLQKLAFDGVLHIAQRLLVLWSKMRGMSTYPEGYSAFGLDTPQLSLLIACNLSSDATNLESVAYSLLSRLEKMLEHLHEFVLWMNYRTCYLVTFRGAKEEDVEKNPFTGATVDMLKVIEFVKDEEKFSLRNVGNLVSDSVKLPSGTPQFFQPIDLVDSSLDGLITAAKSVWTDVTDQVRKSLSMFIRPGEVLSFPVVPNPTNPSMAVHSEVMYITCIAESRTQVCLYRKTRSVQEIALVQFPAEVLHAEMYIRNSVVKLLVVLFDRNLALVLCELQEVRWIECVSGPAVSQVLPISQKRTFQAQELVQISVASDRGLAALLLGDRVLVLVDLEDTEN